jgi:hypothetical protein
MTLDELFDFYGLADDDPAPQAPVGPGHAPSPHRRA